MQSAFGLRDQGGLYGIGDFAGRDRKRFDRAVRQVEEAAVIL